MKKIILVFSMIVISLNTIASEHSFEFQKNGTKVAGYTAKAMQAISPLEEVSMLEPHVLKTVSFMGVDFKAILTKVYGATWNQAQTLIVTCVDGYQPVIKVKALTEGNPYLSFSIKGSQKFEIEKNQKPVDLGPGYLVWKHDLDKARLLSHVGAGNWPYQAVKFNLIQK